MDTTSLSHMYNRSEAAFSAMFRVASETQKLKPHKLKRKWLKLLSSYHMDSVSINDIAALELLIVKTGLKFGLPSDLVRSILEDCDNTKYAPIDFHKVTASLVPEALRTGLIRRAGRDEYTSLTTRYYPLLQTDGLFLSIDPRLLTALSISSQLPTLECCGSPFNHCTDTYCSLFDEDRVYGAYPRFDVFVNYIDYPCGLLVNPPYTPAAISLFIDKVLDYMARHRGEFFFFLPVMYNFEPLDRLLAYPGTHVRTLPANEYTLHSFSVGKTITAAMDLLVIANTAGDTEELLDVIVDVMHEYAVEVTDLSKRVRSRSMVGYRKPPSSENIWRRKNTPP